MDGGGHGYSEPCGVQRVFDGVEKPPDRLVGMAVNPVEAWNQGKMSLTTNTPPGAGAGPLPAPAR